MGIGYMNKPSHFTLLYFEMVFIFKRLIVNLRGNKPLILDKMIYKEQPLAKKLKDSLISKNNPKWDKNVPTKTSIKKQKQ